MVRVSVFLLAVSALLACSSETSPTIDGSLVPDLSLDSKAPVDQAPIIADIKLERDRYNKPYLDKGVQGGFTDGLLSKLPPGGKFLAVWAAGLHDVVVSGEFGLLAHKNSAGWRIVNTGSKEWCYGIWGSSANDIYAACTGKTLFHFDGETWSKLATPYVKTGGFYDVTGTGPTDVYVVGQQTVIHFDGKKWSVVNHPSFGDIWSAMAVGGNLYVAGTAPSGWKTWEGSIWKYDGKYWTKEYKDSVSASFGTGSVWVASAKEIWAAFDSENKIARFSGQKWEETQTLAKNWISAIAYRSSNEIYTAGTNILRFSNGQWTVHTALKQPANDAWYASGYLFVVSRFGYYLEFKL